MTGAVTPGSSTPGAGEDFGSSLEQRIYAESGASVYAVLQGDIHVVNGHPVYRFEPFPLAARALDEIRARQQPSRLLAAESRVVPFAGREGELAQLARWRDSPAPGVSVFLVHGSGGQGKTRLAGQFAVESAGGGWRVWASHHVSDPTPQLVVAPGKTGPALVVVVEYAERWPADDLQLLLQNPVLRRPQRTRVLLVSRPAEVWWPALRHRLGKADIPAGGTIYLQPLAQTQVERRDVFDAARDQFAAVYGVPAETVAAPDRLDGAGCELVLTLHMAALVAVHARSCNEAPPADSVGLSAYLLDREHDYWQSLHDNGQAIMTTPRVMARAVYTATLTRAQPFSQATAILDRVGIIPNGSTQATIDDHAVCYPPSDPDLVLEPLYPDRLGEDFLALQTPGHAISDYSPDQWAATALARLLKPTPRAPDLPAWTRPALTVLIEVAHRWPHVAEHQLIPLLTHHPELALEAGGAALSRLVETPGTDIQLLQGIEPHLPSGRHIDLDVGAAALTQRLVDYRLAHTTDDGNRAELYTRLANRQLNAGLHGRALVSSKAAVSIYRRLVEKDPNAYLRHLSRALHSLSIALSDLGQHEEALAFGRESVDLDRTLCDANPIAYLSDLAASLHHLSIYLSNVGEWKDALAPAQEAVGIYRPLAEADSDTYLPDLAFSLDGLGARLLELARPKEAAAVTREAVAIYRRLAEASPDLYLPGLSASVHNLGYQLSELGLSNEALACSEEAVGIDRRLAKANPGAFLPDLAMSLNNLSLDLSGMGWFDDAVTTAKESVAIRRRLARETPAAYLPNLASSQYNLAIFLSYTGNRENALSAVEEAAGIYRGLSEENPDLYVPELAATLTTLSNRLSELGYHDEAEAAAEEAVGIYRHLADVNPTAQHRPGLAMSLHNLALRRSKSGRWDEALYSVEEAVSIDRGLTLVDPNVHLPSLAGSLNNLGERMSDLRRHDDALAATGEAVGIYRALADANPTLYLSDLADSLRNLGKQMSDLGRHDEALAASREAVRICLPLVEHSPGCYLPDLACSLWGLAIVLAAGRRSAEALDAIQKAIEIYRPLAERWPKAFLGDLQSAAATCASALDNLGRVDEASAIRANASRYHDDAVTNPSLRKAH
jgi:hypothetical protein